MEDKKVDKWKKKFKIMEKCEKDKFEKKEKTRGKNIETEEE